MKVCSKCKKPKELDKFYDRPGSSDGKRSACIECESNAHKGYNPDVHGPAQRRWRKAHPERWMWQYVKGRAKSKGIPFTLDREDIVIPEFCPILGIPLIGGVGVSSPNSPSLDKIRPELGYVKGNVQVVSMRANAMKNDASMEELVLMGKWAQSQIEDKE